jgi:hypothetical protein
MRNLHLGKSHEAKISEAKVLGLRRLSRPTFIMLYGIENVSHVSATKGVAKKLLTSLSSLIKSRTLRRSSRESANRREETLETAVWNCFHLSS